MNYGRFRRAWLSIISRSPCPNPPNSTAASPTEIGKIPWWFDLVPSVPISAPSLISAPPSHLKKVFANKRPYSNKHPSGVSTLIPIRALTPENASIPVSVPIFVSEIALLILEYIDIDIGCGSSSFNCSQTETATKRDWQVILVESEHVERVIVVCERKGCIRIVMRKY